MHNAAGFLLKKYFITTFCHILFIFVIFEQTIIGDTMFKKVILFIVLVALLIISDIKKETTKLVYNEIEDNSYRPIYLLFENKTLNTNNFLEYFNQIDVIKIYPYINPIYAGKIKANYNYSFTYNDYKYDLEKFKNNYIEILRNIGVTSEANLYQAKGVVINKVLVNSSLKELEELLKKDNIKYSLKLNGIYK